MTTGEVDFFIDYLRQDTSKSYFVGAWFETRPYRTPTAFRLAPFLLLFVQLLDKSALVQLGN